MKQPHSRSRNSPRQPKVTDALPGSKPWSKQYDKTYPKPIIDLVVTASGAVSAAEVTRRTKVRFCQARGIDRRCIQHMYPKTPVPWWHALRLVEGKLLCLLSLAAPTSHQDIHIISAAQHGPRTPRSRRPRPLHPSFARLFLCRGRHGDRWRF